MRPSFIGRCSNKRHHLPVAQLQHRNVPRRRRIAFHKSQKLPVRRPGGRPIAQLACGQSFHAAGAIDRLLEKIHYGPLSIRIKHNSFAVRRPNGKLVQVPVKRKSC